ncbi:MAG: helix-turn-helix domain-containing protein [Nitrolancea sp.]
MPRTNGYGQRCPVARTLDVVGERWSLLLVRDLLVGPQRFTDLRKSLTGITPKWLTQRLRDLEAVGIVERHHEAGRREVWYCLTPKGRNLAPVVDALADWGVEYVLPVEFPAEVSASTQSSIGLVTFLNRRGVVMAEAVRWLIRLEGLRPHLIDYDGSRWRIHTIDESPGDATSIHSTVMVETTLETWSRFVMAWPRERAALLQDMKITGEDNHVADFERICGWRLPHTRGVSHQEQSEKS